MAKLLIVDDSGVDRTLIIRTLECNSEWSITAVENGDAALRKLQPGQFDLIVTDLQMPGLNGLDLVRKVRDDFPHIPVVLLTGVGSEEIAMQAIRDGAASYVPKSLLRSDLEPTISRLLATKPPRHARQQLQNFLAELHYRLPNDLAVLSSLTRELRQIICDRELLNESEIMRFVTAVDEALMNAYYHGNLEIDSTIRANDPDAHFVLANQRRSVSPYCDRQIRVGVFFEQDCLRVIIEDEGVGFDLDSVPDPTAPENIERAYGRGLLLMRAFCDELVFNQSHNQVTLVKNLPVRVVASA